MDWISQQHLAMVLLGTVAGIISGLTGFGGGIVIVPILCLVFQVPMQSAIVISLAAVCLNGFAAAKQKKKQLGHEEFFDLIGLAKHFKLGLGVASLCVGLLLGASKSLVSVHIINALFALLLVVMIYTPKIRQWANDTYAHVDFSKPTPILDATVGAGVGTISALIGVGGASYTITYFNVRHDVDIKDGTTISNTTGILTGFAGLLGFVLPSLLQLQLPHVALGIFSVALLLSFGMLGTKLGVRLQNKLSANAVKYAIYALVLICIFKSESQVLAPKIMEMIQG